LDSKIRILYATGAYYPEFVEESSNDLCKVKPNESTTNLLGDFSAHVGNGAGHGNVGFANMLMLT